MPQASGDMLELIFSDPDDSPTAADYIGFDINGQFAFHVLDLEDSPATTHLRWDTGEGDTYTLSDFTSAGGAFQQTSIAGTLWYVEIKVPYSFISSGYDFQSGDTCTVNFNWMSAANARLGTTNPDREFWPVSYPPLEWEDPEVGVRRQ